MQRTVLGNTRRSKTNPVKMAHAIMEQVIMAQMEK